MGLNIQSI